MNLRRLCEKGTVSIRHDDQAPTKERALIYREFAVIGEGKEYYVLFVPYGATITDHPLPTQDAAIYAMIEGEKLRNNWLGLDDDELTTSMLKFGEMIIRLAGGVPDIKPGKAYELKPNANGYSEVDII